MSQLSLSFFGSLQVFLDGQPIKNFRSANVQALLVYLVLNAGKGIPREELAQLLWPDDKNARTNLRQIIYLLRKLLGDTKKRSEPFIVLSRQTATFNTAASYTLDLERLRHAATMEAWSTAVAQCNGAFLDGFVCESKPFAAWLKRESDQIYAEVKHVHSMFVALQIEQGAYTEAEVAVRRILSWRAWDEWAHQQIMRILALRGDRAAALAQYDICYEALREAVGEEPSDETNQLYEQIALYVPESGLSLHKVSQPQTAFFGRSAECTHLVQLLNDPAERLITITGLGGIGKSRLATQVALIYQQQTGCPVRFISLENVASHAQFAVRLAQSLRIPTLDPANAMTQIVASLRQARFLLIFDGAERLLRQDRQSFVETLLAIQQTELNVIITTRQPLRVAHEFVLPLRGLTPPPLTYCDGWQQYAALALFVERAKRAHVNFALTERNYAAVAALCRWADGSPHVIEYLAAQTAHLNVATLVAGLVNGSEPPDAVFSQITQLDTVLSSAINALSQPAQAALAMIGVFQGGFTRAAARQIMQHHCGYLGELIDHALLHVAQNDERAIRIRYRIAPYVAYYISTHLAPSADVRTRHANYYLRWAVKHQEELQSEWENLRHAWAWAQTEAQLRPPDEWQASWLNRSPPQIERETRWKVNRPIFIGRHAELQTLRAKLHILRQKQFAGVVNIIGAAGVGKTQLIAQAAQFSQSYNWFGCACEENNVQALHPFRYWLRTYFGQDTRRSYRENRQRFETRFNDILDATDQQADLEESRSLLAALVGIELTDSLYLRLQPQQRMAYFHRAVRALIKAECKLQPLVIHLEDAHWIDDESRKLAVQLLKEGNKYPLLLLVTARPATDFQPITHHTAPQQRIELSPFERSDVRQLVMHYCGKRVSAELTELIFTHGQGNPFIITQLLHYLLENGLIYDGNIRRTALDKKIDTNLPLDIHNLLAARLDNLDDQLRAVISQAAVLGHEFSIATLHKMCGQSDFVAQLQRGSAAAIWHPVTNDRFAFAHILLHKSVYELLFLSTRQHYHAEAARAVATTAGGRSRYGTLAYHHDQANNLAQATRNYALAGSQALSNHSVHEAIHFYSRGLELTDTPAQQLAFLLGRETAYNWLGKREQQRADLLRLRQLPTQDNAMLATIALRWATFGLATADYELAIREAQRAKLLSAATANRAGEAAAYQRWGRALWQQGRAESAEPLLQQALHLAKKVNDSSLQATCLYDLGMIARYTGQFTQAQSYIEQAVDRFAADGDKTYLIRCTDQLGTIAQAQGEFETAIGYYEQAAELCQTFEWPFGETYVLAHLGNCYFDLGMYDRCRALHHDALAIALSINDLGAAVNNHDTIALTYHLEGKHKQAQEHYQHALNLHKNVDNPRARAFIQTHYGWLLTDMEEIETAGIYLYEALASRNTHSTKEVAIDSETALAWLNMAEGDTEFSLARTRKIVAWLAQNGVDGVELPFNVYWQCYLILKMNHQHDEATTLLENAHALLEKMAGRIANKTLRHSFLTHVPYNRRICEAYRESHITHV